MKREGNEYPIVYNRYSIVRSKRIRVIVISRYHSFATICVELHAIWLSRVV